MIRHNDRYKLSKAIVTAKRKTGDAALERLNESEREKRELRQALEAQIRLTADYQIRVGNALQFLDCVSCGNMSEGFLRSAVSELKSVRRPDAP